jgi:hypothetical protein
MLIYPVHPVHEPLTCGFAEKLILCSLCSPGGILCTHGHPVQAEMAADLRIRHPARDAQDETALFVQVPHR